MPYMAAFQEGMEYICSEFNLTPTTSLYQRVATIVAGYKKLKNEVTILKSQTSEKKEKRNVGRPKKSRPRA